MTAMLEESRPPVIVAQGARQAAKPRFHCKIKTFLKRLDILMITFELHVRNVFRVPKLNL